MIRFASLDLDGTAAGPDGQIGSGLIDGIASWRRAGVSWHIVTGRPACALSSAPGIEDLLRLCEPTVLVEDGEVELDPGTGVTRPLALLPASAVSEIWARCPDLVVSAGGRSVASTRRAARSHALAYRLPQRAVEVGRACGPANRVTVYGADPPVLTGITLRRIRAFNAIVVSPESAGKAAGYERHLRERHGAALTESVAFGDGDGDAVLLARSAMGVAVRGSTAAARAAASVQLEIPLPEFLAVLHPRTVG